MAQSQRAPAGCAQGSFIGALHARYEAQWLAYEKVDKAISEGDESDRFKLEGVLYDIIRETDLIQELILLQLPCDDAELSIVAFHVEALTDPHAELDEQQKLSLEHGSRAVIDFLVSENRIEMSAAGPQFARDTGPIYDRLRFRIGELEGL